MTRSVLVIEMGEAIAALLRRDLDAKRYAVSSSPERRALSSVRKQDPDLIIVDTHSVPYDRAGDLCEALRKATRAPTIVLIHRKWPEEALDGASYLMVSPELAEMSSRIEAVLAAHRDLDELTGKKGASAIVSLGGLQLDLGERTLIRKGKQAHLTPKESRLLFAFMTHPGLVLTRGWLMREVWETNYTGDTRTLYVHVRWLREKIEEHPGTPRLLKTIRGVGYLFDPSS